MYIQIKNLSKNKYIYIYIYIYRYRNGWEMVGVSNLCAPSQGILSRGPFFVTCHFVKMSLFIRMCMIKQICFVAERAQPRGLRSATEVLRRCLVSRQGRLVGHLSVQVHTTLEI